MKKYAKIIRKFRIDNCSTIEEVLTKIELKISKKIYIAEQSIGPGIWGLVTRYDDRYLILINQDRVFGNSHRNHVIAHEIGHILLWEEREGEDNLVEYRCTLQSDQEQEHEVELIGSYLALSIEMSRSLNFQLDTIEDIS